MMPLSLNKVLVLLAVRMDAKWWKIKSAFSWSLSAEGNKVLWSFLIHGFADFVLDETLLPKSLSTAEALIFCLSALDEKQNILHFKVDFVQLSNHPAFYSTRNTLWTFSLHLKWINLRNLIVLAQGMHCSWVQLVPYKVMSFIVHTLIFYPLLKVIVMPVSFAQFLSFHSIFN